MYTLYVLARNGQTLSTSGNLVSIHRELSRTIGNPDSFLETLTARGFIRTYSNGITITMVQY